MRWQESRSFSLGGSGDDFGGQAIAIDTSGNAYVTGETRSTDFPTTVGAFQTTLHGSQDAFVTELNASGSALVYSTYLGGSNTFAVAEDGFGIAVDTGGNAYVVGRTSSTDFPTTAGAFQTIYGGGVEAAFVTKLNPTGTGLVYSTYLGGSGNDQGFGIALDTLGNAYVTGFTPSTNFPTTAGAFQPTFGGGAFDAFVSKLNPTGTGLVYSTYLGGSGDDSGGFPGAIAIDTSGNAYVTGQTGSTDFPITSGAIQAFLGGGTFDAFVTKLNPTGTGIVYSTYLGGSGTDQGFTIAFDALANPNAYVAGSTSSTDFPTTAGAFDVSFNGGPSDAFVVKIQSAVQTDFFLHASGSTLFLDSTGPTATTAQFRDSAGIKFSGGNQWTTIGSWAAAPMGSSETLTSLSHLHVWLGLKNSDDIGTRFDLRAEVYKNSTLVAADEIFCITGVTRNPNLAKEVTVSFGPVSDGTFAPSDVLSLKVLTRIGTNGTGAFCGGHSNAVGLRLYFDAVSRPSRFDATFE